MDERNKKLLGAVSAAALLVGLSAPASAAPRGLSAIEQLQNTASPSEGAEIILASHQNHNPRDSNNARHSPNENSFGGKYKSK